MSLTTVIVSYNTADLLRECLASVFAYVPAGEVVVVDNASSDESVAMVRGQFPQVRLIANDSNPGYAAAINQALAGVQSDFVLVLNSDLEVGPEAVAQLVAVTAAHPEAGMVGPRLILPDGSTQETWRQGFTLGEFVAQQLMLDKLLRLLRRGRGGAPAEVGEGSAAGGAAAVEVGHLHGAALLVRGEALREVGPLDEGYWMYCEDSDWGLRFRRRGWRLYYEPQAVMLHHHGASSRRVRGEMIASYNLAAARYFRLHEGALSGWLARLLGLVGTGLRLLGALLGAVLTLGLCGPLSSRTRLFARALGLQVRWRRRWRQPACLPPLS